MVPLVSLWLPILLSAVFVFFASFLVHMLLPFHRSDHKKLPEEDKVADALRPFDIPPGNYMLPHPGSPEHMRSEEFKQKHVRGPIAIMTIVKPGPMAMGKELTQWFVYCLVVGVFAAYIAGRALPAGTNYLQVFRFAGATAFMCYAVAMWQESIWYKRSWGTTVRYTIDGLIFGLLTAGTFGWLWPR